MAEDFHYEADENERRVISTNKTGWTLELNLISWGGRPAKYDIRSWAPDHEKMGKGVTLTKEDLASLRSILDSMELG